MEEEHKVFIRGVNGRGAEVIKALEERGAKNEGVGECNKEELIYYINHDGYVDSIDPNCELGKIIMDNYHELKLPELWKDGDILVDNDNPTKFLVKSNAPTGDWGNFFIAYLLVNPRHIKELPLTVFCGEEYHKADSEEVRQFHEILHKHGKDWDVENKQLVNWKWKLTVGDMYWIITTDGNIKTYIWNNDSVDKRCFNFGNCFRIREEAEAMLNKIKKLLNAKS